MDSLAQSLRAFRDSFYRCLDRRTDALFELTDALLTAGSIPSPPHLSLAAVHRRGWGSLYAAIGMGRMDEGGLRGLLSRHPLGDGDLGKSLDLCSGRLGVASMRRGDESGARILLPSVSPFGGPAHRRWMGLPTRRRTRLRARFLGGTRGCQTSKASGRHRRGRLLPSRYGRWCNGYPSRKLCPSSSSMPVMTR